MNQSTKARLKSGGLLAAKILAGVVAAVALIVGMVVIVLQTDWGSERLRRALVKRVNAQIVGHLEVNRLAFRTDQLTLSGVRLDDPGGRSVASVADLRVKFRLAHLLHKEVHVVSVLIDRPYVDLVSDDDGTNLARALEARKPTPKRKKPPAPPTKDEDWVIRVERFDLHEGSVAATTVADDVSVKRLALAHFETSASLRYATGNGNLQSHVRIAGQHTVEPKGTFAIESDATVVVDSLVHVSVEGQLFEKPLRVRLDMRPHALETLGGELAVAIPPLPIRGSEWGPVNIDGRAEPGKAPRLAVAITIPGIELTGKSDSEKEFDFNGAVVVRNLSTTATAVRGLTGGDVQPIEGAGRMTFAVGGNLTDAPVNWHARWGGDFDRLEIGETRIRGLTLGGHIQGPELDVRAGISEPEALKLALVGVVDRDRQGMTLRELSLAYPQGKWNLDKPTQVRVEGQTLSVSPLRLVSGDQVISLVGSKTAETVTATLGIERFRLDRLPALVAPPPLHLAGVVDATVNAAGHSDDPSVKASLRVAQFRFRDFSDIGIKADASVAEGKLAGSVDVQAPFVAVETRFTTTTTPLDPGEPIDVRATVSKLDLGSVLSKVQRKPAPADGTITSNLVVTGSADNPDVDLVIHGRRLRLASAPRPPVATQAANNPAPPSGEVALGEATVHLRYARRTAHANVSFSATHGGNLKADAMAKVDLSYPRVQRLPKPARIPVEGKVVARDFDVGWVTALTNRIETMSGTVGIDARLAGTVAEPQFVGAVRWKDGHVITTAPDRASAAQPGSRGRATE